jgi:hypothetical protein
MGNFCNSILQHRDTPENNLDVPFEFNEENKKVRERPEDSGLI